MDDFFFNFLKTTFIFTSKSKVIKNNTMERETGLEPATFSLARRRSTTELFPHLRVKGLEPLRL